MSSQVIANRIAKSFGPKSVLPGVDLLIGKGITTILGPNGAGKTTLLRVLATVTAPDQGTLLIDGLNPEHEADRIEIRRRLGYTPQAHGLTQDARVFDLLDYVAVLKNLGDDRTRRHLVYGVLDRLGLAERAGDRASELSGGMQQRLGVAQALLGDPSLVILDEPASGLDPDERLRLRSIITGLRTSTTVIVSTHLTDEAATSDTVLVLIEGQIRFSGRPERLAAAADGRTWVQEANRPGPSGVRASWTQPDGVLRCLGDPLLEPVSYPQLSRTAISSTPRARTAGGYPILRDGALVRARVAVWSFCSPKLRSANQVSDGPPFRPR